MFTFASKIGPQLLRESEHWYADGAFKVCPEILYQLYTIHVQRHGQIFRGMLQQVFDSVGDNRLQDVDFERAAINAFHLIDENIDMKGCFYHLSSNIWKTFNTLAFNKGTTRIKSSLYIPACSELLPLCYLITSLRVSRNILIWQRPLIRAKSMTNWTTLKKPTLAGTTKMLNVNLLCLR